MKNIFSHSQLFAFCFLFVLSNLLFFQQSFGQCDSTAGCPWTQAVKSVPLPSPYEGCSVTVFYKYRFCDGFYDVQPLSTNLEISDECSTAVAYFGDFTHPERAEELWSIINPILDQLIVQDLYNAITAPDNPAFYNCSHPTPKFLTVRYYRPACRGICVVYSRPGATAPINFVSTEWRRCSDVCCKVEYKYCYNSTLQKFVKTLVSYTQEGENCGSTPEIACNQLTSPNSIVRFAACKDYCTDESTDPYGLKFGQSSLEKPNGILNVDKTTVYPSAIINTERNDLYLELTSPTLEFIAEEGLNFIKILSTQGQLYFEQKMNTTGAVIQIPTTTMPNGLYTIVFETKQGLKSIPLIISK